MVQTTVSTGPQEQQSTNTHYDNISSLAFWTDVTLSVQRDLMGAGYRFCKSRPFLFAAPGPNVFIRMVWADQEDRLQYSI